MEVRLFVDMLASLIGKPARLNLLPPQPADVPETCADLTEVSKAIGYVPKVALEEGLRAFVDWYRDYYVR